MGISGLLPALKSIQVTKQLNEFAGQTIAVDAYVWLHRGVNTCATELATGKPTNKYVDYAMRHVRLLRHNGIEPYIVFDGGPLPAKKGTEDGRKQRREEARARGDALAAAGKHTQARDHYLKSVDVSPQMAFQLIKALRAESVPYVVAPYEADAQLAYLERAGIVDAILTEDSDLLVFGCQNVLFKLDIVTSTVVSISRKDFGSVCSPASDISLVGWSDLQFRAMAILSGCDYLPSIPGIGLKTACSLLRKHRTVPRVVKMLQMEGKKTVPRTYMADFNLADKCFQHQRVYCPLAEKLVYLKNVDEDWTEEEEAYVGADLDPSLAKSLAMGDVCPISLLPIKDINPGYAPYYKPLSTIKKEGRRPDKGKGKATQTPAKEGILSFFGSKATIPPRQSEGRAPLSPIRVKKTAVGKESGKRTLAEVMEHDIAEKRRQKSKFFDAPTPVSMNFPKSEHQNPVAGPSRERGNKENVHHIISEDEDCDNVSIVTRGNVDEEMEMDLEDPMLYVTVTQEDGYLSPTSSCSGEMQDLSSPARLERTSNAQFTPRSKDLEFGADVVSSPPSAANRRRESNSLPYPILRTRSLDLPQSRTLLHHPSGDRQITSISLSFHGPDLRDIFADGHSSDIDCSDEDGKHEPKSNSPTPPTLTPPTAILQDNLDDDDAQDPETLVVGYLAGRTKGKPLESFSSRDKCNSNRATRDIPSAIETAEAFALFTDCSQFDNKIQRDQTTTRRVAEEPAIHDQQEIHLQGRAWIERCRWTMLFVTVNDLVAGRLTHVDKVLRELSIASCLDTVAKALVALSQYPPILRPQQGTQVSSRQLDTNPLHYLPSPGFGFERSTSQMSYPESSQRTGVSEDIKRSMSPHSGGDDASSTFSGHVAKRMTPLLLPQSSFMHAVWTVRTEPHIPPHHPHHLASTSLYPVPDNPTYSRTSSESLFPYSPPAGSSKLSTCHHSLTTSSIPMCNDADWSSSSVRGAHDQTQHFNISDPTATLVNDLDSPATAIAPRESPDQLNCDSAASPSSSVASDAVLVIKKKKISKMHQCEVCGKMFPRPSGLKTHMNTHNNLKPFSCGFEGCKRTFTVRSNAKRHLRTHGVEATVSRVTPSVPFTVGFDTPTVLSPSAATHEMIKVPNKLRWMPPSLSSRNNAATLCSVSDDESSDDESVGYAAVPEDQEQEDLKKSSITVPFRPVIPSAAGNEPFEERNSYLDAPRYPYHPTQASYLSL
ncbi:hypothetical protein H0H87_002791 [Tephrocybe sp. NHM501043]|nr:hypothetical protein H0H87_002791 [Tephrocybe sp. NHM501043]